MLDIESSALIDLLTNERSQGRPGLKEQLREVVDEHERSGKPVMEIIENFGIFTKKEMLEAMAENLGSYVWIPTDEDLEKQVIDLIEVNTARSYGVIPLKLDEDEDMLHLAMRNPLDYQTVESLRFIINHNILPVPVDPDRFDQELERYYPEKVDTVADIVAAFGEHEEIVEEVNQQIVNDDTCTIEIVNKKTDWAGDSGYTLRITNNSASDICVDALWGTFSVNGTMADPVLSETIKPGCNVETFMWFGQSDVPDLASLVSVEGELEVYDANTYETIATYPFAA